MMDRHDKRKYERLGAQFELSCRKIGSQEVDIHEGYTVNISQGGVYFRTTTDSFERGDLLKVELSIPPKSGLLVFGGKMAGFAKVLRADNIDDPSVKNAPSDRSYGVALQFCRPPKLCI
jgi:hypothetical protein